MIEDPDRDHRPMLSILLSAADLAGVEPCPIVEHTRLRRRFRAHLNLDLEIATMIILRKNIHRDLLVSPEVSKPPGVQDIDARRLGPAGKRQQGVEEAQGKGRGFRGTEEFFEYDVDRGLDTEFHVRLRKVNARNVRRRFRSGSRIFWRVIHNMR
ncbi:MAG: hypothetical protein WCL50_02360 [Spirochaetota bacterium]